MIHANEHNGRRPSGPGDPVALREVRMSNDTVNAFMGNRTKSWMLGPSQRPIPASSPPQTLPQQPATPFSMTASTHPVLPLTPNTTTGRTERAVHGSSPTQNPATQPQSGAFASNPNAAPANKVPVAAVSTVNRDSALLSPVSNQSSPFALANGGSAVENTSSAARRRSVMGQVNQASHPVTSSSRASFPSTSATPSPSNVVNNCAYPPNSTLQGNAPRQMHVVRPLNRKRTSDEAEERPLQSRIRTMLNSNIQAGSHPNPRMPEMHPPDVPNQQAALQVPYHRQFFITLNEYAKSVGGEQALNDVEGPRMRLLREACHEEDLFYLSLHQLYCISTCAPQALQHLPTFGQQHMHAFMHISALLVANERLPPHAVKFYANFPITIEQLLGQHSGIYRELVDQVLRFLTLLGPEWDKLCMVCRDRGYPPFVDDLVARFSLVSPVLQRIMFTAIHRSLGGCDMPHFTSQVTMLFTANQQSYQQRVLRNNTASPPSLEEIRAENDHLAAEYLRLSRHSDASSPQPLQAYPNGVHNNQTPQPQTSQTSPPSRNRMMPGPPPRSNSAQSPPNNAPQFGHFDAGGAPQGRQHLPAVQPPTPVIASPSNQPMSVNVNLAWQLADAGFGGRRHELPTDVSLAQYARVLTPQTSIPPLQQHQNPTFSQSGQDPPAAGQHTVPRLDGPTARVSQPHLPPSWSPASYSAPLQGYSQGPVPHPQVRLIHPPFLPPLGQPGHVLHPQPLVAAMHQAHLRSPPMRKLNADGKEDANLRYYQFFQSFAIHPSLVDEQQYIFFWDLTVSRADFAVKAVDVSSRNSPVGKRSVKKGSRLYRLRCIKLPSKKTSITESEWVVADNYWPTCCYPEINGNKLEVRRRSHHHKDLPMDLTRYIKESNNEISITILRTKEERDHVYFIGVEVIEIADHTAVQQAPQFLAASDALSAITKHLQTNVEDDDLVVVDEYTTIDVADPFTARIFDVPVRGHKCLHRECFDLETFLQTRRPSDRTIDPTAPTSPDEWRCPICGLDARPQSLVIDGFLQDVRDTLGQNGALDTKAILVRADGSWTIKEEKKNGNENGRPRSSASDGAPALKADGAANHNPKHSIVVNLLDD